MEEGKGGEGIYYKAMFEYQLGSSSEIPKVLKKVRTHLSQPTRPQPTPSQTWPGWLRLLLLLLLTPSCGIILNPCFLMIQHPSSINRQGVKPAKTSGSSPARHHFQ